MNVKQKLLVCAGSTALVVVSSLATAGPASAQVDYSLAIPKLETPAKGEGYFEVVGQPVKTPAVGSSYVGGGLSALSLIASRTGGDSAVDSGVSARHGDVVVEKKPALIDCGGTSAIPVLQVEYRQTDPTYVAEVHLVLETNIPELDAADEVPGDGKFDELIAWTDEKDTSTDIGLLTVCLPS